MHKDSVIVVDLFYNDFHLLNVWDSKGVFFVKRHKDNVQYSVTREKELPENKHPHLLKDEIIEMKNEGSKNKYPKRLRRITNHFHWVANTIGELYKGRWQIKIFFREIKQLQHIKTLIGTSENAVLIQIWTALITILIMKALNNRKFWVAFI